MSTLTKALNKPNNLPPSSADFESFSNYISQLNGTALTYDSMRSIIRQACKCYVPKITQLNKRFYALVITPEVFTYLQSLTRNIDGSNEHVLIPAKNYKVPSEFDNEVGAIHEFRFFLANETCSPNMIKFLTDFNQRHQISCNDSLTFSVTLKEAQLDQNPSS